MVKKINAQEFEELLKGDKPVVCDFFATWCGPCRMLSPIMEQLSEELGDKATFVKVDIDECAELAIRYGIMSIPLVTLFVNGEEADKMLGFTPIDEMREFIVGNLA